jgi:hypothetical protein
MAIEDFEELQLSSFINVTSFGWKAPTLTANFGGGYGAGAIVSSIARSRCSTGSAQRRRSHSASMPARRRSKANIRAVKPVRLRYLDLHGELSEAAVYIGDTTFWQSVCRLARAPRTVARVELLPSLPTHGHTRQHLARTTHATVSGIELLAADGDPATPPD